MGIPAKSFNSSLSDYISESIGFLKAMEPAEGYFVGFSGGKDSITTLELCRMAGVKHQAFYSCPGIDPPEVAKFIRQYYPEVIWLHPKRSFFSLLQVKNPPLRRMRWCCDELKKVPTKNVSLKCRIMGIRAEESARRASRPRISPYRKTQILMKPIYHWPEWAVWDFIDSRGLPYPSLYDEGFSRIGCVVCPFTFHTGEAAQQRLLYSQQRWPGLWKAFEHAVKHWFTRRVSESTIPVQERATADEFYAAYLSGGKLPRWK